MQASETSRITVIQVTPNQTPTSWVQNGAKFAGIVVAGRCIVVLVFFGLGLMLMGTVATATSSNFDNFDGKGSNPPRTIGIIFLSLGGALFVFGTILICIAKSTLEQMSRENQVQRAGAPVNVLPPAPPVLAGTPHYPPQTSGYYQTGGHQPAESGYYHQQPLYNHPSQPSGSYPSQPAGAYATEQSGKYPPQHFAGHDASSSAGHYPAHQTSPYPQEFAGEYPPTNQRPPPYSP